MSEKALEEIFEQQRSLMVRLGIPHLKAEDPELRVEDSVTGATVGVAYALTDEIHEFTRELNWKPWKRSKKEVDLAKVHEELIDAWHFLVELSIMWGMSAEDVYAGYVHKNQINHERQNGGY